MEGIEEQDNIQVRKESTKKNGFLWGLVTGVLLMAVFCCVTLLIFTFQAKKSAESKQKENQQYTLVRLDNNGPITPVVLEKMQNVMELIHRRFYLDEVTDEQLLDGMYKGMVAALEDPFSEYYTVEELQKLLSDTSGVYYGIGAYVSIDQTYNMTKVSGVIAGSPAEEAKLRANDIIYEIDGVSTYEMSLDEAVKLIKGDEGTETVLTIIRDGETLKVPIIRRKVESPTVNSEMLPQDMGYLQIVQFDDVTPGQFKLALDGLKEQGMKGLILDLRANPGGTLDGVVDIAGQILPEGLIVYTEDKEGKRNEYYSDGKGELQIPIVVLVDMNTASAAEILSGAIQDYEKGTIIGTTTYGKGIVQSVISLPDDSAVKITVSAYYTPKGRNIHKLGIEPDIVCEFDADAYYGEEAFDNQLEKAKEVLTEKMKE